MWYCQVLRTSIELLVSQGITPALSSSFEQLSLCQGNRYTDLRRAFNKTIIPLQILYVWLEIIIVYRFHHISISSRTIIITLILQFAIGFETIRPFCSLHRTLQQINCQNCGRLFSVHSITSRQCYADIEVFSLHIFQP